MVKPKYDLQDAVDALYAIDPGMGIDDWVRVSMAARAAGISFDVWDEWCSRASNYPGKAQSRAHWRSFAKATRVGVGTLFYYAAQAGWKPRERAYDVGRRVLAVGARDGRRSALITKEVSSGMMRSETAQANSSVDHEEPANVDPATAQKRDLLWQTATPADPLHPYLVRKQIPASNLRQISAVEASRILGYTPKGKAGPLQGDLLIVPCFDVTGALRTLEFIDPHGRKTGMAGLPRAGCFWISDPTALEPMCRTYGYAEGVATASSLEMVVGYPVIACGSWGNVAAVVDAINAAFPGADTVVFPDRGAKQEQKAAEIAMSVLGQSVPLPEALPERSDYNDFVSDRGIDAARQWIANTLRSTLRRVSFVQARAIGRVPVDEVLVGLPIGSIGMIVGQGAIGKTMLMMQVAAGLALGRDLTQTSHVGQSHFLSPVTSQPRRVALILGEDSHDLVHNRLVDLIEATGLDDRDVHQLDDNLRIYTLDGDDMRVVSLGRDRQMSEGPLLSGLARLGAWADLLVLDPLVRLSDADENDNTAASAVMLALSQLAKTRRTAIVVLHHVAKASGAKGEKGDWRWARGAAAYSTSSRWQVLLRPVEDEMGTVRHDVVRVEMVKHNYTRAQQPFGLVRGPHGVLRFDLHAQSSIAFAAPNGAVATPTAGVRARDLLKRGASSGYDDPFE